MKSYAEDANALHTFSYTGLQCDRTNDIILIFGVYFHLNCSLKKTSYLNDFLELFSLKTSEDSSVKKKLKRSYTLLEIVNFLIRNLLKSFTCFKGDSH